MQAFPWLRTAFAFLISVSTTTNAAPIPAAAWKEKPKLILVIVVDQFRSDYLSRFAGRFLPAAAKGGAVGGFEYLKTKGAYFPHGQYDILQSMTGPGHSMILSGTYPYQSGIALNTWFNPNTNQPVYCGEDESKSTVGALPKAKHLGTSPRNFSGTTLGDELKNAGYSSRVVALALKDRAAIFMGGHRADGAFWLDSESYSFVSSRFYFPDGKLPAWVSGLNLWLEARKGKTLTWTAGVPSGLSLPDAGNFPYRFETASKKSLSGPFGVDVTVEAAERAIAGYGLGQGKATDVLAVSFSSHDYLGHQFGPNSRELEEMTVYEDRAISRLLNYVQKQVPGGLKQTLIVLTADHGAPPDPTWLTKEKISAGRWNEEAILADLEKAMVEKFGEPEGGKWFGAVTEMNFYWSAKAFEGKSEERSKIEAAAKTWIAKHPSVAHVFSLQDYRERKLPPGIFERQILKTYYPGRSGDLVAILKPFHMTGDNTVMHMTGYKYDTTVPILFLGSRIQPGVFSTPADVVDIAPTLAFLLGVIPPSLSDGKVLSEILK